MPPTPSGQISFLDIIQEFGNLTDNSNGNSTSNPDPVKLGAYRTSVSYKDVEYPLDEDVPTSGAISFDDLRDKRLNVIVKVHTSSTATKGNAKSFYDANEIKIVGDGRDKKFKNSRIHIVVTGRWGSEEGTFPTGTSNSQTNRKTCAVRTGSWKASDGTTPFSVDLRVGGNSSQYGYIIGGGGRGGAGGASDGETDPSESYKANGHNGCIATSGLGLDTPLRNLEIRSPGRIQAGCGGGGGGGGAGGELDGDRSNERAGGGGGGGGAGIPGGQGGAFGIRLNDEGGPDTGHQNQEITAQAGTVAESYEGGAGGNGADNSEEQSPFEDAAQGGGGGGGGGISPGDGGQGTEGAQTGAEGEVIDGTNEAEQSGEGGAGGNGDAEGQGQQVGTGGLGGQHGLAIDVNGNAINSITGSNRIYGRYNLV